MAYNNTSEDDLEHLLAFGNADIDKVYKRIACVGLVSLGAVLSEFYLIYLLLF